MIEENCYVLWDDSHEAVVVDCGAFYPEERKAIADFIADNGLLVKRLLQTHAHFDHLFGADFICHTYGVRPEMHRAEADTYAAAAEQALGLPVLVGYPDAVMDAEWFYDSNNHLNTAGAQRYTAALLEKLLPLLNAG